MARHPFSLSSYALATLLATSACTSAVEEAGSTLPGRCEAEAPLVEPQRTDILFVIDSSGSMREEQEGIATELPAFVGTLQQGGGVAQDFRVGVVTTDVYLRFIGEGGREEYTEFPQAGRLRAVPGTNERFLEGTDPELVARFGQLVSVGTQGSGQEAPFEAVRLAVETLADVPVEQGGMRGFLRDGARLLVVVVTDEEDCSSTQRPPPVTLTTARDRDLCVEGASRLTSVEDYATRFQNLRDGTGALRPVIWASIAPVARADKRAQLVVEDGQVRNVDCPTSFGPGLRHRAMAERFNERLDNLDSICRSTYRQSLVDIAALATATQSIDVMNVPDPLLLRVQLERADGSVQTCSVAGGDVRYERSVAPGRPAQLLFQGGCPRRADDRAVRVELLCAG